VKVRIGRVGRPHGLDGAFVVENASTDERWWRVGARFQANGDPVEVVGARRASGRPVVKLDRAVERGALLEVDRAELPSTGEDEYYAFELVGLEVVEEGGRPLGTVKAVTPGVANDVLDLGGDVLLPMVEDCIRRIDLAAGLIEVAKGFAE
jgi:16S rRNA processing protein RimM